MEKWSIELEGMPHFDEAMERVEAWFAGEIIDRAPVKFSLHNVEFSQAPVSGKKWDSLRDCWFDAEYQVDNYIKSIEGKHFIAETFPVFYPNLGPNVYASFYGGELRFGEVTSWFTHFLEDLSDAKVLRLNKQCVYYKKIIELTECALSRCAGKYIVGYTDLHPGVDCVVDWRSPERMCEDLYEDPEGVKAAIGVATADFQSVYDYYDAILKAHRQLSVTWMGIPSFGKMHIPSCDFSALISTEMFINICMPVTRNEVKQMTHNIWHLDGPGCIRHLDEIMSIPEIQAIQWVQGVGDNEPILQWAPLIKRIQDAGKSVVVNLHGHELRGFMDAVSPRGIFLCVGAQTEEEQLTMLKDIEKWR